jgi:hypothetical protein
VLKYLVVRRIARRSFVLDPRALIVYSACAANGFACVVLAPGHTAPPCDGYTTALSFVVATRRPPLWLIRSSSRALDFFLVMVSLQQSVHSPGASRTNSTSTRAAS